MSSGVTEHLNPGGFISQFYYKYWLKYGTATLLLLTLGSATLSAYMIINYTDRINRQIAEEKESNTQTTQLISRELNAIADKTASSANDLARNLAQRKNRTDKKQLDSQLADLVNSDPNIYGGAIVFSPSTSDNVPFYMSYLYKDPTLGKGKLHHQLITDFNYTHPKEDNGWYWDPIEQRRNLWGKPYEDVAGATYMVTYSAIIYSTEKTDDNRTPIGLVTIDIAINRLKTILEDINKLSGFGALTTRDGLYVYHPNYDYVKDKLTLLDVAKKKNDDDRRLVAELAKTGKAATIDHISTTSGEQSWLVVEPVDEFGWSIQNTFFHKKAQFDSRRKQHFSMMTSIILTLILLGALLKKRGHWSAFKVWSFSAYVSILLAIGLGYSWHLALHFTDPEGQPGVKIVDQNELEYTKSVFNSKLQTKGFSLPIYIPTGIYIETLKLDKPNEANISGYIWQRLPADFNIKDRPKVQMGISNKLKFFDATTYRNNLGEQVVKWRFQADIMNKFNYSRFPLEVENITISLNSEKSDKNIVLIPDLNSFDFAANRKPGIDKNVFIPGWSVTESQFSLKKRDRQPLFGSVNNFDKDVFPELTFSIRINRIFIDAFISNLTPLIVVSIILFSVSLLPTNIDISRILGICVSVFFVIVFSHLGIRRSLVSGEIFYLEYFFFAIYATLLAVPLNAFRDVLGIKSRFFEFKNGIIHKALYWPMLLLIFYSVTVAKFY